MPSTRTRPAQRAAGQENPVTDVQTAPAPTADATATATPEAPAANGAAPAEANGKSKKNSAPIQLTVPLDLKAKIEARVTEKSAASSARYILETFAKIEFPDYTLPPMTRTSTRRGGVKMTDVFAKTLTPEQKQATLTNAKMLLEALNKGLLNMDDIKAKLGGPAS